MPDLAAFFHSVKFPVISEAAHSLIQTLNDEDASTTLISNIISKHPALTAKSLRLVNSGRFGQVRGVSLLDDAIAMVGIAHLASLLADTPGDDPAVRDSLPEAVVHALQLNPDWMRAKFPSHDSFVDVSSL